MYLGIDLGTSSVKSVLMNAEQAIVVSASAPLRVTRPEEGWSEQAPADWITAAESSLQQLQQTNADALAAVRGIGLSGHMHGATLLDAADEVIRPCILWNDTRSHVEAARLDTPRVQELSGNILFPGFTAPKLAWVAEHEPEHYARVAKVLLPKDYLRLWLTGEHVAEMSDAAGTGWLDVGQRAWSDELLGLTGLDRSQMPSLVEGTDVSGHLRPALAAQFGMSSQVVVAGGAGDNAASACGMGTVAAGSAFVSLGTSGVLFAANDTYRPNAKSAVHTFCHALPDTWHQMGVILAATDALNWWAGVCGSTPAAMTAALDATLEQAAPVPAELLFLPYLGGERTPHNDASARGAFIGLSHSTDTNAMTAAVLQGVAFAFRDCQQALASAGTDLQRAAAIGGGSASRYWLQLLADVLSIPLDVPADGDFGASLGAARLGLIAAETADPVAVCSAPAVERVVEPGNNSGQYSEQHQRYQTAYRALVEIGAN